MPDTSLCVILATRGRADILPTLLENLAAQTRRPDRVLISAVDMGDVPSLDPFDLPIEVLLGPSGLPDQRNRGLEAVRGDCDIAVFFDDDFIPSRSWLADAERFFADHRGVVGLTGRVLADGASGPGILPAEAVRIVSTHDEAPTPDATIKDVEFLYGCNMAYRLDAIEGLSFDERLPLYAWMEDHDFTARLRRKGRCVKVRALAGVHMGTKNGRTSGVRLGMSQILNPVYLWRKGSLGFREASSRMIRNSLANLKGSVRPPRYIDRRGRLRGNLIGVALVLTGRASPDAILRY